MLLINDLHATVEGKEILKGINLEVKARRRVSSSNRCSLAFVLAITSQRINW